MTTDAQTAFYLAQHKAEMQGKGYAVYNPQNKPLESLPIIYGFNNGGSRYFLSALLIAEDGTFLGSHACTNEGYMPYDLGILEGERPDRHEGFKQHYPEGYRMDFVSYDDARNHQGLVAALRLAEDKSREQ